MKIALLTPCSLNISAFGARTISASLKARGHGVRLLALPVIPEVYRGKDGCLLAREYRFSDSLLDQICERTADCDLVGISFMSQYRGCARQITAALKARRELPVVWGGVHPTVRPEECLDHADIVCIGEGEETMVELADRLHEGRGFEEVPNLCFRRGGTIQKNPLRPLLHDLDRLPFLDYDPDNNLVRDPKLDRIVALDDDMFERFLARVPYVKGHPLRSFMFSTTRGCPYKCTYCVNDFYREMYGSKGYFRRMSNGRVVAELEAVIRRHPGIEEIEFCDDNFAARPVSEILDFCKVYKERIGLPFQVLMTPGFITEDRIAPMLDAGMVFVETGIQSAADSSAKLYHRSLEVQELLAASEVLKRHRGEMAPPCYHLILDNPFESVEETLATLDVTLKLPRPFWFKRSSLIPFPGTSVYDSFKEHGHLKDEQKQVFDKILEMPGTCYLNFLFFMNSQNHPKWLIRLLAAPSLVAFFNRPSWTPVFGRTENALRTASKILRWTKLLLRGDWAAVKNRIALAGKIPSGVPSSQASV